MYLDDVPGFTHVLSQAVEAVRAVMNLVNWQWFGVAILSLGKELLRARQQQRLPLELPKPRTSYDDAHQREMRLLVEILGPNDNNDIRLIIDIVED